MTTKKDFLFINNLAAELIDTKGKDLIKDIAIPKIKKHTKAEYAHFSIYDPEAKVLTIKHIETGNTILDTLIIAFGEKLLKTKSPVSKKNYKYIITTKCKVLTSLTELSFGAIPPSRDQKIKKLTGFNYFYVVPQVDSGTLYGVTILAFKKVALLPPESVLKAYSTILAIALRKNIVEKEREKVEARFKVLVENATDIIFSLTQNGIFNYVSPNWEKALKHKADYVVGKSFTDFIHKEDVKDFTNFINSQKRGQNKLKRLEYRICDKNGNWHYFEANMTPLKNPGEASISLLAIARDITSKRAKIKNIEALTYTDDLTGLYNRRYVNKKIETLKDKENLPLSIILADANGLKLINDGYGHQVGDKLLKGAAQRLRMSCRKTDIIARWGGDEFVILLPKTNKETAELIAQRISEVHDFEIKDKSLKHILPVSLATGVATKTRENQNIKQILNQSEDCMYAHKLTLKESKENLLIQSLVKTLTSKGFEESHINNMREMGKRFAEKLNLDSAKLNHLNLLISIHDIGKIHIPENILVKKKDLTKEDFTLIREHPASGYRIAKTIEKLSHVSEEILSHHERWDGEGYPRKLKKTNIPYLSRVLAILDSYEVMTYGRPYKKAKTKEQVIKEFQQEAGKQFDPELTEVFVELLQRENSEDKNL